MKWIPNLGLHQKMPRLCTVSTAFRLGAFICARDKAYEQRAKLAKQESRERKNRENDLFRQSNLYRMLLVWYCEFDLYFHKQAQRQHTWKRNRFEDTTCRYGCNIWCAFFLYRPVGSFLIHIHTHNHTLLIAVITNIRLQMPLPLESSTNIWLVANPKYTLQITPKRAME